MHQFDKSTCLLLACAIHHVFTACDHQQQQQQPLKFAPVKLNWLNSNNVIIWPPAAAPTQALSRKPNTHTVSIDRDREKTSVCVSMRRKAKAAKNCVHRKTNRWRIKPTCRQAAAVSRRRSRCRQSSSTFGRRRQALHCYSTIWCQAIGRQAAVQPRFSPRQQSSAGLVKRTT